MRVFTKEFKREAVDLAVSLGNTAKAAKQLGIPASRLYQWKTSAAKSSPKRNEAFGGESVQEELQRLRREVSHLKKVNHVLKAAAAFFSQDHLK